MARNRVLFVALVLAIVANGLKDLQRLMALHRSKGRVAKTVAPVGPDLTYLSGVFRAEPATGDGTLTVSEALAIENSGRLRGSTSAETFTPSTGFVVVERGNWIIIGVITVGD